MAVEIENNAETRAILLSAARELVAADPNFSLKTLLITTGVSRAQFRSCFADKEQLLAALTGQEVKGLSEILEMAQPAAQTMRAAVGSDIAPAAQPSTDAWLERRLRVFERALAGLEKRQEKSEHGLAQQLALIGEQLAILSKSEAAAPAVPVAPQPKAQLFELRSAEFKTVERPAVEPEPIASTPVEPAPAESELAESGSVESNSAESGSAESLAIEPGPVASEAEELTPAAQAFVEEIAAVPGPAADKEAYDFLANARRAAQNAALAERAPPKPSFDSRWLIWSAAVLIVVLACAGVLILNGALGGTATAQANSGVSHRQTAQDGIARVMALADNGNAAAQTALAIAYLNGRGVAADEEAAKRWGHAAAEQGQPMAQYLLGTLYLESGQDKSEAARWFLAAAGQGNVKAMHNLAIAYAEGLGVDKDPAQAVQWFVRAADEGYRDSEFDLAVLYERGMGVPQSAQAALKWYLIAAAHGDAPSAARAAFLQEQMDTNEAKQARAEAASFVPQKEAGFANQAPAL